MNKIRKRDGSLVDFNESKISVAISKANRDVPEKDRASDVVISRITRKIGEKAKEHNLNIEEVQDMVETELMRNGLFNLAKAYITFRYERAMIRKSVATDKNILQLIHNDNVELREENSNKNTELESTKRDYIAGEISRDISLRLLLPERVVQAHKDGVIHFHDLDYFVQTMFNCCLPDVDDMLANGTVLNGKLIESPKCFQVACTVLTQIIACIASNQYGGQSIEVRHLAKFLARTEERYTEIFKNVLREGDTSFCKMPERYAEGLREEFKGFNEKIGSEDSVLLATQLAKVMTQKELRDGIQTIQYQINTLMTTNGQAPFVTLFLTVDEDDPYCEYNVRIIEEILNQRIEGIKNEAGQIVTPAFPKLVYVLDECNCLKGGKYDWLTKLAVKCSSKRMYPDYISAKKMRENYEGNVFAPMGCRSFLSPWKDSKGNYKFEGRFNQGVVSINLPQIGILAQGDEEKFWELLEDRLGVCFEALMCRHKALKGTLSNVSPIHWQYGAIARLPKGAKIDKLLYGGYSTLSLGYIGVYEATLLVTGESHTAKKGKAFAFKLMQRLRDAVDSWKRMTNIGFALYGTPAESLCYRFARIDKEKFGEIKDVTDKGYYTNSYHVDVREKIDAFNKLIFESGFQVISSGGAISYVEIPNMMKNLDALEDLVTFIYDNIQYAEFNTKSDTCQKCGYEGEITLKDGIWECPNCHNTDQNTMNVVRRTCGYLGENFWNVGKTSEIEQRVMHL